MTTDAFLARGQIHPFGGYQLLSGTGDLHDAVVEVDLHDLGGGHSRFVAEADRDSRGAV